MNIITYTFDMQILSPAFGGMISFVKETEPLLDRGQSQVIKPDERKFIFEDI